MKAWKWVSEYSVKEIELLRDNFIIGI